MKIVTLVQDVKLSSNKNFKKKEERNKRGYQKHNPRKCLMTKRHVFPG